MKTTLAALFLVAAAGLARAEDKPVSGDLAKLQGTWKAMAGENKDIPIVLVVKGTSVEATYTTNEGQEVKLKGELKIDENSRPKTLDWVKFLKPNGEEAAVNRSIYELTDDEFKVCNGGPGNERPTEFKDGDGGTPHLLVFKKEKDSKSKASN